MLQLLFLIYMVPITKLIIYPSFKKFFLDFEDITLVEE